MPCLGGLLTDLNQVGALGPFKRAPAQPGPKPQGFERVLLRIEHGLRWFAGACILLPPGPDTYPTPQAFRTLEASQGLAMDGGNWSEERCCTANQLATRLLSIQGIRQHYGDLIDRYMRTPGSVPLPDPYVYSVAAWRSAAKQWKDTMRREMQIPPEIGLMSAPFALPPGIYQRIGNVDGTMTDSSALPPGIYKRAGHVNNGQETLQASAASQASQEFQNQHTSQAPNHISINALKIV